MAFLYHAQHTHVHAFLQSFGAVGADHRHCQLAGLLQKNAAHGVCVWDCGLSKSLWKAFWQPKWSSWKQNQWFPKTAFLCLKYKVSEGRNSAFYFLYSELASTNTRSIIICLRKWTIFSTVGFKPIYTGYTSRYYQIWFSLNNSEGLVKWAVWAKTEENKQHPWCQLTKGLVHHFQRKKNTTGISTLQNRTTSYRDWWNLKQG